MSVASDSRKEAVIVEADGLGAGAKDPPLHAGDTMSVSAALLPEDPGDGTPCPAFVLSCLGSVASNVQQAAVVVEVDGLDAGDVEIVGMVPASSGGAVPDASDSQQEVVVVEVDVLGAGTVGPPSRRR